MIDDEIKTTPAGECCAVCVPNHDCSVVKCAQPNCEAGQIVVKRPGECCQICVPGVEDVLVGSPVQQIGCASCSNTNAYNDGCNDCVCDNEGNTLSCTKRACLEQKEPFCQPDCSAVLCLNPVCE
eukprot:Awhi_evm1s9756